jgi:hypothetical protein
VLSYAAKHGYTDLVDAAAMEATGWTLENAYAALAPEIYTTWVKKNPICFCDLLITLAVQTRYYGLWVVTLDFAHHLGPQAHLGAPCNLWMRLLVQTTSRLGGNPGSLRCLDTVFRHQDATPIVIINPVGKMAAVCGRQVNQSESCLLCFQNIVGWRDKVREKLQALPKFSSYL